MVIRYKHANVYRNYQVVGVTRQDGTKFDLCFNAESLKENCVLLPREERRPTQWNVPRRQTGATYGFGQSNVWFADDGQENKLLEEFLKKMIDKIENYQGENWIDFYPEI